MLVITRAPTETVIIGDGAIKVHIISVQGKQVRLGIEASKSIPIYRQEHLLTQAQSLKNHEVHDRNKKKRIHLQPMAAAVQAPEPKSTPANLKQKLTCIWQRSTKKNQSP